MHSNTPNGYSWSFSAPLTPNLIPCTVYLYLHFPSFTDFLCSHKLYVLTSHDCPSPTSYHITKITSSPLRNIPDLSPGLTGGHHF
ncbi:hypothetical protein FKM82_005015 [Ascaphus truei]